MAIPVPDEPKINTTKYDNFKGVDLTNDHTNVWRRRSPTGLNMLPDASGRPFKRTGWEILIDHETICNILGVGDCIINKLAYFELAGQDHLVIFADSGVIFFNGSVTAVTTDSDCCAAYDRCFFFEGGGTSAFYIYSNSRIWMYDESFTLNEVTSQAYAPRILIGTSANCVGTMNEGYNLVGNRASIEYNDIALFAYWCSKNLTITVSDETALKTAVSAHQYAIWEYNGSAWVEKTSTGISLASHITVNGTPEEDDAIVVVSCNGVLLPNNVAQNQVSSVEAFGSTSTQFDTPIEVLNETATLASGQCKVCTDPTGLKSWIVFGNAWSELVPGEDFVRVTFPVTTVSETDYANVVDSSAASLDAEVVA